MVGLLMAAMLIATPGESLAKKKKKGGKGGNSAQRLKAQAAAATRQAAAVAKKQAELSRQKAAFLRRKAAESQAKLSRVEEQIRTLDPLAVKDAQRHLENTSEAILGSQENSSPFGQARQAFEKASQAYALAREKAFDTPEYKAAYQRALVEENRASAVARLRRETLESDRGVQQARLSAKITETEHNQLRDELLQANRDWQAAVSALRFLKQKQKKTAEQNAAARLHKFSAKSNLSKAAAGAARQQGLAERNEAVAKKFAAAAKKLGKGSRNNRKRKRKRK
jgi:hypothetical protein